MTREEVSFSGPIAFGDGCRVSEDSECGSVWIGDRDVVSELPGNGRHVTVVLHVVGAREVATISGVSDSECGWGYSEYTPMDPDTWTVGERDVLAELLALDAGTNVEMCVSWEDP